MQPYGAEVCQGHTRILRVSLAAEESRAYWKHLHLEIPKDKRVVVAFEERWFGSKSMERVRTLDGMVLPDHRTLAEALLSRDD